MNFGQMFRKNHRIITKLLCMVEYYQRLAFISDMLTV